MIKKTGTVIFAVLAFLVFVTLASANTITVKAGGSSVCEDASWIVYNLSETKEANIQFDIGPYSYAWEKKMESHPASGRSTDQCCGNEVYHNE